jgi:hypothetical protein
MSSHDLDERQSKEAEPPSAPPAVKKPLTAAAERALAEAAARRAAYDRAAAARPHEVGRREGPDPVRYGDWERNGIASDF